PRSTPEVSRRQRQMCIRDSFNYCKGVFLCAAIFFMLRGDLMSSFSFLLAGIVAFKIAEKI
ncbi:hypothetical protein ACIKQ2_19185, partial [Acinetobacter baumannii]|uniref:hypothetical protein n=1 Tax=Acinetobacter baumannii TaxID=470 RepID=UPI0037D95716